MAAHLGISSGSVSKYERGLTREFSEETEERMAKFYGVTIATIRREAGFRVEFEKVARLIPAERGAA